MRPALFAMAVVLCGCGARTYQVVRGNPFYSLRWPDRQTVPFPEVPAAFARSAFGWVDLRPGMGLRLENAVYREGAAKRDISSYVRVDLLRYRVRPDGCLVAEPSDRNALVRLDPAQLRFPYHRFYYQIAFKRASLPRSAVVLGGATSAALAAAEARLHDDPDSICAEPGGACATFPDTATVSVEIEIVVNGSRERVHWGSTVASVARNPAELALRRVFRGRLIPVQLDLHDPEALRLPLLPGDALRWR